MKNIPIVINGCSELFVALWGEDNGKGVRSAVGMGSLPGNVAVGNRSDVRDLLAFALSEGIEIE
jgi:hypothetical protein